MNEFLARLFGVGESRHGPRSRLWYYAAAVLVAIAALAVRASLEPLLAPRPCFVIPFLAVIFVAWLSGFWPSMLTLAISMLGVVYFFVPPRYSFAVERVSEQLDLALFFLGGVGCALLGEARNQARHKAEAALADSLHRQDELHRLTEALKATETNRDRLVQERTAELRAEIEERKKAEQLVEAVLAELRRSNGELEQFAYVASHDLQEPLRKIQAFGTRLEAKYREQLDEQGQDYLGRMQNSAKRMQLLINDLLTFSRVSTRGQEFCDVDLAPIARDAISDLEARTLQTGGIVRVGDLPTLRADPLQMRQLLQNLIGNALKFARPDVVPVVEVAAVSEGDAWCLTVSDNGIGFDERYLDRIFQVFQRLHGRGTYEGTGVGLAICKKIAERHGGAIAARSQPGEGSVFVVTLPRTPPTEAR